MSTPVGANGQDFAYPVDQETGYAAQATGWAQAVTAALDSIGRGSSTSVTPQAVVDMRSTTKGFLIPRMTTTQIAAISSPPEALMVYDTDLRVFKYRRNGVWVSLGSFVEGDLDVNGNLDVSGTGIFGSSLSALSLAITNAITAASATLTGAFQALTGIFTDATDATNSTTAPLKTAGGLGVAKKLYVGTDANIGGNANITGDSNVAGNGNITGKILTGNGSASLPTHSFLNETNSGLFRESAGVIGMSVLGTKRFSIDSNGYFLKSNNVAGHFERTTSYSAAAVVNFDTAIINNTNYNTTNGRFTAPVSGTYLFYVQGIGNISSRIGTYFRKNGVTYTFNLTNAQDSTGNTGGTQMAIIQLNTSEYVDVFAGYAATFSYNKSIFFGFYLIG